MNDMKQQWAILQAICDLDDKIVAEFFPKGKNYSHEGRDINNGYLWLKSDIIDLLSKSEDVFTMSRKIEAVIKKSPYADVIFNKFIQMDELMDEVEIRKDFSAALKTVKVGRDLAPRIGYAFSAVDIRNLALLHKANKYRKKIESLLEACNFHYENGKFDRGEYEEFLQVDSADKKEGE